MPRLHPGELRAENVADLNGQGTVVLVGGAFQRGEQGGLQQRRDALGGRFLHASRFHPLTRAGVAFTLPGVTPTTSIGRHTLWARGA